MTSRQPRPSKSKGNANLSGPIRSITLTISLESPEKAVLDRLKEESGVSVDQTGGRATLVFRASSADQSLSQLRMLSSLLTQKR